MSSLQIIGAGLGRTGTSSLKMALEELGFDPCHHMFEVLMVQSQRDLHHLWKDIAEGNNVDEALMKIFEGYKATVDIGYMFFEKLMSWNPDAKVILSVRDSPEAWETSCRNTILPAKKKAIYLHQKLVKCFLDYVFQPRRPELHEPFISIFKLVCETHGVDVLDSDTDLKKVYSEWEKHVIAKVPAEKLLVFNAKEGWGPLCKFLAVPVPDHAFPKRWTTEQFQNSRKPGVVMPALRVAVLGAAVAGVGALLGLCYERRSDILAMCGNLIR